MIHLSEGSTLQNGKYRIVKALGTGGFGITYLAFQVYLNRSVAIKEFFMKDFCDRDSSTSYISISSGNSKLIVEEYKQKFIKEAQTIASLNHPNIVKIHDIFEENGTAYYVMEYHDNGSLLDLVKQKGPLTEKDAISYVKQIGEALSYLHKKKVLHLDIKPSNVLLNNEGEAVLIDFGISKHYDSEGGQTSTTPIGISKGYAPMEQYQQGSITKFSPATDVYSLGATFFYLLTGKTPPEATEVNEEGLPEISRTVGNYTEQSIKAAMMPRRKDRPQSIAAFLFMLEGRIDKPTDESTLIIKNKSSKLQERSNTDETTIIVHGGIQTSKKTRTAEKKRRINKRKTNNRKKDYIWLGLSVLFIFLVSFLLKNYYSPKLEIDGHINPKMIISFDAKGGVYKYDFYKYFEEELDFSAVPEWIKVITGQTSIIVSCEKNTTSKARSTRIKLKKKGKNRTLSTLYINQETEEQSQFGCVKISSKPQGAAIWVDGKYTRKITPDVIENITYGKHIVKLVLDGYEDNTSSITITSDQELFLDKNLAVKPTHAQVSVLSGDQNGENKTASTGYENGHEWVDLGLSVKWATCNVGASSPSNSGDYYAWGEISPKREYHWENYLFYLSGNTNWDLNYSKYNTNSEHGNVDGLIRLSISDDVASVIWQGDWRMPTYEEFQELIAKCTWKWTLLRGVKGYKIISKKNGNSIFLPAVGYHNHADLCRTGNDPQGLYWSSSLLSEDSYYANFLFFSSSGYNTGKFCRTDGLSIRPVVE